MWRHRGQAARRWDRLLGMWLQALRQASRRVRVSQHGPDAKGGSNSVANQTALSS